MHVIYKTRLTLDEAKIRLSTIIEPPDIASNKEDMFIGTLYGENYFQLIRRIEELKVTINITGIITNFNDDTSIEININTSCPCIPYMVITGIIGIIGIYLFLYDLVFYYKNYDSYNIYFKHESPTELYLGALGSLVAFYFIYGAYSDTRHALENKIKIQLKDLFECEIEEKNKKNSQTNKK
jgi:hypothetical protein